MSTGKLVAEIGTYQIYQCHDGYSLTDSRYHWSECHCHGIKSLDVAKQIIDNVLHERIPTAKCGYVYDSHIRLAGDTDYREQLEGVKIRRKARNQIYYNSQKGVR